MNKTFVPWIVVGLIVVAVFVYAALKMTPTTTPAGNTQNPQPVACTMEAKQCPDGSYVGRTGPRCEFAPCPSPAKTIVPVPSGY